VAPDVETPDDSRDHPGCLGKDDEEAQGAEETCVAAAERPVPHQNGCPPSKPTVTALRAP